MKIFKMNRLLPRLDFLEIKVNAPFLIHKSTNLFYLLLTIKFQDILLFDSSRLSSMWQFKKSLLIYFTVHSIFSSVSLQIHLLLYFIIQLHFKMFHDVAFLKIYMFPLVIQMGIGNRDECHLASEWFSTKNRDLVTVT